MTLHASIREEIKDALRAKDEVKLRTIRGMVTAFTNELVATSRKPQEFLTDEEVIAVIRRLAKQRKESIEQFRAGNRDDLVEGEVAELAVLETYLPQLMSREDILKCAVAKKAEMNVTDKAKAGILMGALMKDLKGQADGPLVKEVIDSLF